MGKLSVRTVTSLTMKGRYSDGDNLILQIGPSGNKSWLFAYMRHGRNHQMGLGPVSLVTLAEAREEAFKYRRLLLNGVDPLEHRRAERARPDVPTFAMFAQEWIATNEAGWRNDKHKAQWKSSLKRYAEPLIGSLRVDAVTTDDVMRVLKPIWSVKAETASRVQQRIAAILDAAKARGLRSGDNPAEWKGRLKHLLPAQSKVKRVKHHGSVAYTAIPKLMAELRDRDGVSAKALEFCILTASRASEVINAAWDEIDWSEKTWTLAADRTKQGRAHRVPLSNRAVEILKSVPRVPDNPIIFAPNILYPRGLSDMAMLELLRGLRGRGNTVHGTARSGFRTWASETGHPRELAEAALGHVVGDQTERAYARGDMFERRRALMEAWAAFCDSPPKEGRVVPMRRKGKAS
jgi:integrase